MLLYACTRTKAWNIYIYIYRNITFIIIFKLTAKEYINCTNLYYIIHINDREKIIK